MRRRLFIVWAALRWLPLMFLVAQGLEAPLVAHVSQPVKPIRVWTAKTSWYGGKFQGRKTASGENTTCLPRRELVQTFHSAL